MTDKPASYFTEQLLRIYHCKVPFELRILHTKPKGRCGSYWKHNRHILINDKFITLDTRRCLEVAIHEYAHHLHYTEFDKDEKKDGPRYRLIIGFLAAWKKALIRACTKRTDVDTVFNDDVGFINSGINSLDVTKLKVAAPETTGNEGSGSSGGL